MKKLFLAALVAGPMAVRAQSPPADLERRLRLLEDRAALQALVDTFSILADKKDVAKQVLLFTEDATVESRVGDAPGMTLRGR